MDKVFFLKKKNYTRNIKKEKEIIQKGVVGVCAQSYKLNQCAVMQNNIYSIIPLSLSKQ